MSLVAAVIRAQIPTASWHKRACWASQPCSSQQKWREKWKVAKVFRGHFPSLLTSHEEAMALTCVALNMATLSFIGGWEVPSLSPAKTWESWFLRSTSGPCHILFSLCTTQMKIPGPLPLHLATFPSHTRGLISYYQNDRGYALQPL